MTISYDRSKGRLNKTNNNKDTPSDIVIDNHNLGIDRNISIFNFLRY